MRKKTYEECVDIPCVQVQLENKKNVFLKRSLLRTYVYKKVNEKKNYLTVESQFKSFPYSEVSIIRPGRFRLLEFKI